MNARARDLLLILGFLLGLVRLVQAWPAVERALRRLS